MTTFTTKAELGDYMLMDADWDSADNTTIQVGVDLAWDHLVKSLPKEAI